MPRQALPLLLLACLLSAPIGCSRLDTERHRGANVTPEACVTESTRTLPVLYDADVVVVGGTSGAVAAAVAAADNGGTVFLAAPRPYLGEDVCGTYRLWLEPDEEPISPLARAMFAEPDTTSRLRRSLPFTYEADVESAVPHRDSQPPSGLHDAKWHSAPAQSVQYNGDVNIVADLGAKQTVGKVRVMAYQRTGDFEVAAVTVYGSDDKRQWRPLATVENERLSQGSFEEKALTLSATVDRQTRYLKFAVSKTPGARRVLLGELLIEGQDSGSSQPAHRVPPTPMQVKRVLDDALLNAGVRFLYGCYPTDLLRDGHGRPAGIVMADRSGRQAVKAKVIIDATPQATVARMAGARFEAVPGGTQILKRIVVGGAPRTDEHVRVRKLPAPVYAPDGNTYTATEYTLEIPVQDGSFASYGRAEQIARDQTWQLGQVDASEILFQIPSDHIAGRADECCQWPGAEKVNLDVFRPAGTRRLYVLGGCAHVSRHATERMLRVTEFMDVGSRVGAAAAAEARRTPALRNVTIAGHPAASTVAGDIRADQGWMRAGAQTSSVTVGQHPVPVLGQYDVVVVGGGTGGAPAGIAAARQGAKTLVVEYLYGLGGVGTMGLIGKYYYGNRVGFTQELDQGLVALGGEEAGQSGQAWDSQVKMEWYRRELRKAGADIWYGTLGGGALVEGNQVTGVVVATPLGRGVVLAKAVVDATGSAVIAAAAGARSTYITGEHIAVQGTGLPPWDPGARYTNTDFAFIDDLDVVDASYSFLAARKKFDEAYDLGQLVDSRERRQIVGDFCLSPMDAYLGRTFPDTIVRASSNFDSHGYTIHPLFMLRPPDRKVLPCCVPYRCLLPQGIEGILVTGLAVSAHRDVMPVIRMQADIQNQGYAAGVAAAMAARAGKNVRDIDVRELQWHLVEKGNLPAAVLTQQDSFPLPEEKVKQAVETLRNGFEGIEVLFAQPEQALPLLGAAYAAATSEHDRLIYAHILGIMGDPAGTDTLVAAVRASAWDEGWKYTGMGQYGPSMSPVDGLIIALGRTRQAKALEPILAKVRQLGPEHALSHHRAVAIALETLADPAAAPLLAELLQKPGMMGHAYPNLDVATRDIPPSPTDTSTRECSLRELLLARALYRCGDCKGLGAQILHNYAQDLRGHYARHALAILQERRQ